MKMHVVPRADVTTSKVLRRSQCGYDKGTCERKNDKFILYYYNSNPATLYSF